MPLFKASDESNSKPKWLTDSEKTSCLGADATEAAASAKIMHQGWTVSAGGNGNPNAQRETLACVNMTSDIGTSDDSDLGISSPYVEHNGKTEFGNESGGNNMNVGHYGGNAYFVNGGEWEERNNASDGGVWENYDAGFSNGTNFTLRVNDTTDINCSMLALTPNGSGPAQFVFSTDNSSAMTAWIATVGSSVHKFSLYKTYQG